MEDVRSRLDAAVVLAREAGRSTLDLFRSRGYAVDRKADGSEVTAADRGAEQLLRRRIEEQFPGDGVLGEEFGETSGRTAFRWVLDPIDGTASFVRGVPLYGTLVAVQRRAGERWECVAGVIVMPALDEVVFAASGHGAWHAVRGGAEVPARVSGTRTLAESLAITTSNEYFRRVGCDGAWEALAARVKRTRGWSDCYAHLLVATGRADLSLEPSLHIWDIAPAAVIVREAGGRVSDWRGGGGWDRQAVISNGAVHDEAVGVLRGHAIP
jgi:histidinol phosphatase-like enzyme (inositol monophosphatase family)